MGTPRQITFMQDLAAERLAVTPEGAPHPDGLTVAEVLAQMGEEGEERYWAHIASLPIPEVSAKIDRLLAAPKKPVGRVATYGSGIPGEDGTPPLVAPSTSNGYVPKRGDVHFLDGGTYVRIHIAQKSGNPYACTACVIQEAIWAEDGSLEQPGTIQWDYAPGLLPRLSTETLTTAEEAAAFGRLVGRCCFCSHAIDTPESTAVGYGPICAEKYGLPWGDTTQELSA